MKLYQLPNDYLINQENLNPIALNIQLLKSPLKSVAVLRGDVFPTYENMQSLGVYNDCNKNGNTVCVVFKNQLFSPKEIGNISKRILLKTAKKESGENRYSAGCEWYTEKNESIFKVIDVKAKDLVMLVLDIKTPLYNGCVTSYKLLFKKDAPNLDNCIARLKNIESVTSVKIVKSPSVSDVHYLGYYGQLDSALLTVDDYMHI